jgi:hypothetical protein
MNIFRFKKLTLCTVLLSTITNMQKLNAATPLGMFAPYDINIKVKKPAHGNLQFNLLGEKSYNVHGYATNAREDQTFFVNPLQIYEPLQNVVSMYQGFDDNGASVQTITTPFTQLLDSIAGGPGGGVSNGACGLLIPTANLSCGQIAGGLTYGLGQGFYISAFLPFCFAKLCNINWKYVGQNALFAEEQIQTELIDAFTQDALTYFDLNVGNWSQRGLGDLTFLAEWQRDFPQRRLVLRNVQANIRIGISLPTAAPVNQTLIFPIPFGGDGAVGIPFGGGLNLTLGGIGEIGFSGQFWYFCSNERPRRIQTFPTQTSLLLPVITQTYKEFAIVQNFNLFGQIYSTSKRFSAKGVYQHWRRQKEKVIPLNMQYNFDVANATASIDEFTRHQFSIFGIYSPIRGDFKRMIPQFEVFWKGSFGGTRAAIASTYGAQFSLIF